MTDFDSYHFTHKISLYSNITHNEYTIDFKLISTNLTRKSLTKIWLDSCTKNILSNNGDHNKQIDEDGH